jgi:hypothetical protein
MPPRTSADRAAAAPTRTDDVQRLLGRLASSRAAVPNCGYPAGLRAFQFFMVPIVAKYIARADAERATASLISIGASCALLEPRQQIAALQHLFETVGAEQPTAAVASLRRMLRFIAEGSRS